MYVILYFCHVEPSDEVEAAKPAEVSEDSAEAARRYALINNLIEIRLFLLYRLFIRKYQIS